MTPIFLYGTLRHAPLLAAVAGKEVDAQPARLADHAVRHAGEAEFPQIFPEPGAEAQGLLVQADKDVVAAFDFYEGAYGYTLRPVTVTTAAGEVPAQVYWPPDGTAPGALWDLKAWVRTWGPMTVSAVPDILRLRESWTAEQSRQIRPFALSRGWARQLAHTPPPATLRRDPAPGDVRVTHKGGGHMGFFGLRRIELAYRQFNGQMTDPFRREVFMSFDVALVLPYDPVLDKVLLIEQLRFGPILREDPRPWVLEAVAGLVDAGETPETAALREAREEAGLRIDRLVPMPGGYPSPGYTTEYYHNFLGIADLSDHTAGPGGLAEEAEDIRSHILSRNDALALAESGEITAVPLQNMLYWLDRHRTEFAP